MGVFDTYVGVDIANLAIEAARTKDIANASFEVCDAYQLLFTDDSFEVVVVKSLLHHLRLDIALPEIDGVLGRNGVLCLREPLGVSPLF